MKAVTNYCYSCKFTNSVNMLSILNIIDKIINYIKYWVIKILSGVLLIAVFTKNIET